MFRGKTASADLGEETEPKPLPDPAACPRRSPVATMAAAADVLATFATALLGALKQLDPRADAGSAD